MKTYVRFYKIYEIHATYLCNFLRDNCKALYEHLANYVKVFTHIAWLLDIKQQGRGLQQRRPHSYIITAMRTIQLLYNK